MTLNFNPQRAMVMIYSHAKIQGQQSVGYRVETDGRTEVFALPSSLMWSVVVVLDFSNKKFQIMEHLVYVLDFFARLRVAVLCGWSLMSWWRFEELQ